MRRLSPLLLCLTLPAIAQDKPLLKPLQRLMGEPKDLVLALLNYPWKPTLPDKLDGLERTAPGNSIRIAAVERPVTGSKQWVHFQSPDGKVWVDFMKLSTLYETRDLLQSARQPHSGFHDETALLLFSNRNDAAKEGMGAALLGPENYVLNVGIKLPLAVTWDKDIPAPELKALEESITRLQAILETLARQMLDPAYVTFSPKVGPKPEALPLLRIGGLARLWSLVKYNFVYLDRRPEARWETVLERYMPRVAAAKDDIEYGRILEEVVALLKDGHTNVYPNFVEPKDGPLIQLEPIGGKPVATTVGTLPEVGMIKPGMELLEIDGRPVQEIITRDLDPYISSSTVQDRQLRQMRMLMLGPPGSSMRTKWLSLDGSPVEATLTRNRSQNRAAMPSKPWKRFEYKELAGNVAYMALNDFSDPGIVKDFESRLSKAMDAKAWILDLRLNGGGSSNIAFAIVAHFLREPGKASLERIKLYNPTFQAIGTPQPWHEVAPATVAIAPGPRYEGPVYVLTSPNTCSAAEDFLIPLKMSKRATQIGEPTCGSTGQPLLFSIYGATARICTKEDRFPDGTEWVGIGVVPDLPVARTKMDVASGIDPELQRAIALSSSAAQ